MIPVALRSGIGALLRGDSQADRVVPPTGFTARLTVFAAAAMAFLAVCALAVSVASARLAERWSGALDGSATIRITAPQDQQAAQVAATLRVLETTPGILTFRALSDEDMSGLLVPWLGDGLDLSALPVPGMIELSTEADFDPTGLRLRLSGEVPGAVLDDHGRWRAPLAKAAGRLWWVSWAAAVVVFAALAAMVTLAAQAALAANAQVIAVLRLVGATDNYIALAFVRRFTLRALTGGLVGMVLAVAALALVPSRASGGGLLTVLGFSGGSWLLPLIVPVVSGGVALVATARAAQSTLRNLT